MKQFPSQFGRSDQYRNPDGTLPMPSPEEIPRPEWYGPHNVFKWADPRVVGLDDFDPLRPGVTYRYIWTSPIFDLRPDLRSSQGATKEGTPIWSTAARLYVQLFAPNAQFLPIGLNLSATATEYAQVVKAQEQRRVGEGTGTPPNVVSIGTTDVTSKFTPPLTPFGQESVLAGFSPPGTTLGFGDGYPIRYWRVRVTFVQFIETGLPIPNPLPPPNGQGLNLQAAVY